MDTTALVVWSMALGSVGTLGLARTADWVARPTKSRVRAVSYHLIVFVLVLVQSGVLVQVAGFDRLQLHVMQVMTGPLCVGLSNLWISGWLRAAHRDRLMATSLGTSALLLPLAAGLALLLMPREQHLPAAAAISVLGGSLTLWLTLRGWRLGDPMALLMAAGCLLTLPAIAGLYLLAMDGAAFSPGAQAALALCAALSNALTGLVLWRRDRHEWRAVHDGASSTLDPVTRLHSGAELVRRLLRAQQRRRRTGREGALIAVIVFDVQRIATHVGSGGVNEMWMALAARLQRQVGVVNPVGRYWDRCFIVVVETIPSRAALRTLGLRVASSLRKPVEVTGLTGERMNVWADLGVGVVHLPTANGEPEDILDEAQRLAEAARQMRSRAAIYDRTRAAIVPVEEAGQDTRPAGGPATAAAGPEPLRQAAH